LEFALVKWFNKPWFGKATSATWVLSHNSWAQLIETAVNFSRTQALPGDSAA
jgi:hypothetical protein